MEAEAAGRPAEGVAHDVLRKQSALIGWQIAGERMGAVLKGFGIAAAAVAAVAVGAMVWQAAHADGVVIDAFSVPPDFPEKGLTGEVVAGQIQDRLLALQAATVTNRAAATFANNWGRDIKVNIPQTGVSIGDLQRYLREWLGHETRIGGEIFKTPHGLRLTIRANGEAGDPVDSADAEVDALLEGGALALYKKTQPYRWAIYKAQHGAGRDAEGLTKELAASGPAAERGWAHNLLSNQAETLAETMAHLRAGIEVDPKSAILRRNLGQLELALGHSEAARIETQTALTLINRPDRGGYSETAAELTVHSGRALLAVFTGDHLAALKENSATLATPDATNRLTAKRSRARLLSNLHQPRAALTQLDAPFTSDAEMITEEMSRPGNAPLYLNLTRFTIAREQGDWAQAYAQAVGVQALVDAPPNGFEKPGRLPTLAVTLVWPATAEALAHLGRIDEARALIARTPTDCYQCLRARAKVAELAGERAEADRWFAEAARLAPHFNAAQTEWGQALLARRDYDLAISQFAAANRVGPHFADPIEGWGEALLAKGDAAGAAAKFAEAARHAPNWGRLHLNWGEALAKLGKPAEAKAQWNLATRLDLTPAEQAGLQALTQKTDHLNVR